MHTSPTLIRYWERQHIFLIYASFVCLILLLQILRLSAIYPLKICTLCMEDIQRKQLPLRSKQLLFL